MTGSEVLTAASGTIATGLDQWTWKEVVWELRKGLRRLGVLVHAGVKRFTPA